MLVYETYHEKFQPYFGQDNLQFQSIDTDSFALSINAKDIIKDLQNVNDFFDSSSLVRKRDVFNNEHKNVLGKLKIETLENFWIDDFLRLGSKVYPFKCGSDN